MSHSFRETGINEKSPLSVKRWLVHEGNYMIRQSWRVHLQCEVKIPILPSKRLEGWAFRMCWTDIYSQLFLIDSNSTGELTIFMGYTNMFSASFKVWHDILISAIFKNNRYVLLGVSVLLILSELVFEKQQVFIIAISIHNLTSLVNVWNAIPIMFIFIKIKGNRETSLEMDWLGGYSMRAFLIEQLAYHIPLTTNQTLKASISNNKIVGILPKSILFSCQRKRMKITWNEY